MIHVYNLLTVHITFQQKQLLKKNTISNSYVSNWQNNFWPEKESKKTSGYIDATLPESSPLFQNIPFFYIK